MRHGQVVTPKAAGAGAGFEISGFEIPLAHNSVVTWSLETNRRFRHKIVLDAAANPTENEWLGFTLRTSKTYVSTYVSPALGGEGAHCVLEDGVRLTWATDAEAKEMYQLRARENAETDFTYPPLTYTISPSDLLPPQPHADAP